MVSRMRTGVLSDEATVKLFPLEQTISMKQAYLAPRVGNQIFIPKKAKYMFKNLNLPKDQEQAVLKEFLRRSLMQEITYCCPPIKLNTKSTDRIPAQTSSRPNISDQTLLTLINMLNNSQSQPLASAPAPAPTLPTAPPQPSAGPSTSANAGPSTSSDAGTSTPRKKNIIETFKDDAGRLWAKISTPVKGSGKKKKDDDDGPAFNTRGKTSSKIFPEP